MARQTSTAQDTAARPLESLLEQDETEAVDHADDVAPAAPDSVFLPEASDGFVSSPYVEDLTQRALAYLEIGYPLHLAGFAGTGKTTIAFHIAAKLGRPVILIHGNDEFVSSDLTGKDVGYKKSKFIDNYIHSVLKSEENMRVLWMENRLTTACRDGYTLIYDEFNRSRAEANNVLLSVLEEKMLSLPSLGKVQGGYIEVHPEFRAIFTSNPEEYAGVHKAPDALMDRLITLDLGHYDRETEIRIAVRPLGNRHAPTAKSWSTWSGNCAGSGSTTTAPPSARASRSEACWRAKARGRVSMTPYSNGFVTTCSRSIRPR